MRVRPAVPEDARGIAETQARAWDAAYRGLLPDAAIVGMGWEDKAIIEHEARTAGADMFLLKDRLSTTLLPAVNALTRITRAKQPS